MKYIDTLERITRRATEINPGIRDLSYEDRLQYCGLTTVETRRLRVDENIFNGYENINKKNL